MWSDDATEAPLFDYVKSTITDGGGRYVMPNRDHGHAYYYFYFSRQPYM